MTTTWIRNADWVVAWDGAAGGHAYLRGADVVFAGDALTFVGHGYRGRADETIDGRRLMVMPGLVDLHAHPNLEAAYRGIREEHGVPEMAMTGLFERSGAYWPDQEGMLACAEAAYCELLLSGVTTLVDISGVYPGWIDLIARSGLRGVVAPAYASARWVVRRSHLLEYEWNEAAGRKGFEDALSLCDEVGQAPQRAALRTGLAGPDRHLHRGPPARQRRRRAAERGRPPFYRSTAPGRIVRFHQEFTRIDTGEPAGRHAGGGRLHHGALDAAGLPTGRAPRETMPIGLAGPASHHPGPRHLY